jgi:hypothetical protein
MAIQIRIVWMRSRVCPEDSAEFLDKLKETSMKRVLELALLSILFSAGVMAAQNSQTFYLGATVRAGDFQLPRGIYEVTWGPTSKSRVTLSIKAEGEKTFKVLARVVEGKQDRTGVVTCVVDGVPYLHELHTSNAKFILQNRKEPSR